MSVKFAETTLHVTSTELSRAFFSKANVDLVQTRIRAEVFRVTGRTIDRQNDDQLLIIMRGIFGSTQLAHDDLDSQLRALNRAVLSVTIPQVLSGIRALESYLHDLHNPRVPLDHGLVTSKKGESQAVLPVGL